MANRVIRAGQIERALSSLYKNFFNQIKREETFPWDLTSTKTKFENQVYTATRKAITEVYMEGANYVGYKYREDVYPTDTDLLNIKSETDRSVRSFWFQIGEDAKRVREQEVDEESKKNDRKTESFLNSIATVGVTSGLAISTFSKTNQLESGKTPAEKLEEPKPKLKWITKQDEKVCPICQDLDGETWDYDDVALPVPARNGPNGTHTNCRCYLELIMT